MSKTKLHKILKKYRILYENHLNTWDEAQRRIRKASEGMRFPNEEVYKAESYKHQRDGFKLLQEMMHELEGVKVFEKKKKKTNEAE